MPDIKAQLRTYFDETAERVTEEDVRIRATTDWGVAVPSPRFRPRPLAAGAIGFGLAMTLLGMVLVVDRVFGAGMSEVGGNGGPSAVTTSEPGSLWLFIPVLFGLGLLATGIISAKRRNGDMRERGGRTMQTIEKVDPVEAPLDEEMLTLKKRSRWLGWLAGLLAVAVVGLGIWLIAAVGAGTSMPSEVEAAVDAYTLTWETADREAFLSATTSDYTFMNNGNEYDRDLQAFTIGRPGGFFSFETLDQTVSGDGPYYVGSAERIRLSSSDNAPAYTGHSTVTVTEVDGVWKVSQHTWVGDR